MHLKNCCRIKSAAGAVILWISRVALGAEPSDFKPGLLWSEYDPDAGDFREEVVSERTADGILMRESYISAYVLGEEIRVYCKYSVKEGATRAPGLLDVHGWMGAPSPGRDMVLDGWAVMAHDYCGKTAGRPHYTRYPDRFWHGNMDRSVGFRVDGALANGQQITDPRQCSDYLWYALERRALSGLHVPGCRRKPVSCGLVSGRFNGAESETRFGSDEDFDRRTALGEAGEVTARNLSQRFTCALSQYGATTCAPYPWAQSELCLKVTAFPPFPPTGESCRGYSS